MPDATQKRGIPVEKVNQAAIQRGGFDAYVCPICQDHFPIMATEDEMERMTMEHLVDHSFTEWTAAMTGLLGTVQRIIPQTGGLHLVTPS